MLVGPHATKQQIEEFRPQAEARAGWLHRPADLGAFDLPDLRRLRRGAASRRPSALRALGSGQGSHRAGRADTRRAERRFARGQFQPGRRNQGHLGARCLAGPPTISTGSRATSSARSSSPAFSMRRPASPPCRPPMAARATNGRARFSPPARRRSSRAHYDEANERNVTRVPGLQPGQSVVNPQLLRAGAVQCPRGAHRDHGRDVGGDQQRLSGAAPLRPEDHDVAKSSPASWNG